MALTQYILNLNKSKKPVQVHSKTGKIFTQMREEGKSPDDFESVYSEVVEEFIKKDFWGTKEKLEGQREYAKQQGMSDKEIDKKIEEALNNERNMFKKSAERINTAIKEKSGTNLWISLSNTDNKVSRKLFEKLTGENIGKTQASLKEAIKRVVGEEKYNKDLEEKEKNYKEERAKKDEEYKQYQYERDEKKLENTEVRANGKLTSVKAFLDQIIEEGYANIDANGRKFNISNDKGQAYSIKNKIEKDYLRRKLLEVKQ